MSVMGRPPVPTALKVLQGNPGKRPLNTSEPTLEVKPPECPEHLDEVAKREWERIVPILLRMRVLTEADEIALGNLCQTYSTMIEAQKKLHVAGLLYKTKSDYVQPNPLFDIVMRCKKAIDRSLAEFGLTPSARVRLQAMPDPTPKANKWADVG